MAEKLLAYFKRPDNRREIGTVLLLVLLLTAGQFVLYDLLSLRIKESVYDSPIFGNFPYGISWKRLPFLIGWLGLGVGLAICRPLRLREVSLLPRVLFVLLLSIQTYTIALMDYNHYFDSFFVFDRILLFCLAGMAIYNPLTLPLFLLHLTLLTGQLAVPEVIGYDHTHKSLIIPLLTAFWVLAVAKKFLFRRMPWNFYVVFFLAVQATWYLQAGWGKLQMDWVGNNNLYHLFAASVDAGWLHQVDRGSLELLGQTLSDNRYFIQAATLFVELVCPLLLLLHRKVALFCLVLFMGFHLTVYLFSGIFFWQWIAYEAIIAGFLLFRRNAMREFFKVPNVVAYYLLLLVLPYCLETSTLAWFDCGYINSYTFKLVGENGREKILDSSFFSPYDVGIAKNRFAFSSNRKVISSTLGQCFDAEVLILVSGWKQNVGVDNLAEIEAYRSSRIDPQFDVDKQAKFYRFLRRHTTNKLTYDPAWISRLDFPLHMQQGPNQQNLSFPGVDSVRIIYHEKVVLPALRFETILRDSVTLSLKE